MRNYTELTAADKELVLAYIGLDMEYKEVAEKCNVKRRVVSKIAIENGIRKRRFINRNMKIRECGHGYKPRGTQGELNHDEVEVNRELNVPGTGLLNWIKSWFFQIGRFSFRS